MNKPNILFIMTDQHRYDCCGFNNGYPVKTPRLDALAAEGVCFDNAYTPTPLCCPARMAFLNGRRAESFGAYWNNGISMPITTLQPEDYSFVRDLTAAGYHTVHIGKEHVSSQYGIDSYGYSEANDPDDGFYADFLKKHTRQSSWDGCVEDIPYSETHIAFQTDVALEALDRMRPPFMLTVSFPEPHLPCYPCREYYEAQNQPVKWHDFDDDFTDKPYIQKQQLLNWGVQDRSWRDWAPVVKQYYAVINELDTAVGRLLDRLKALGLDDDTIIVYTPDHGDMCGAHRMRDKHYILYEDVVHVPLVIKVPGIAHRRTAEYTVHFLDLGPTLLELAGVASTADVLHGYSLVPVLKGHKGSRRYAVSTYNGQQCGLYTQRCIKTDRYKYVWNLTDTDELYDLSADPGELINVIGIPEYAQDLAVLRSELLKTLKAEGDSFIQHDFWCAGPQLSCGRKLAPGQDLPCPAE